jgi:hypothetical protein
MKRTSRLPEPTGVTARLIARCALSRTMQASQNERALGNVLPVQRVDTLKGQGSQAPGSSEGRYPESVRDDEREVLCAAHIGSLAIECHFS